MVGTARCAVTARRAGGIVRMHSIDCGLTETLVEPQNTLAYI